MKQLIVFLLTVSFSSLVYGVRSGSILNCATIPTDMEFAMFPYLTETQVASNDTSFPTADTFNTSPKVAVHATSLSDVINFTRNSPDLYNRLLGGADLVWINSKNNKKWIIPEAYFQFTDSSYQLACSGGGGGFSINPHSLPGGLSDIMPGHGDHSIFENPDMESHCIITPNGGSCHGRPKPDGTNNP